MTFIADAALEGTDESLSSVPSGAGPADGAATRVAEVHAVRELIASMILPGAGDTPGSVSQLTRAVWVDLLGELGAVKNAVTATQARLAVALEEATRSEEAAQGVRAERRGRGVPNQVGAAMRCSPHAGASFLSTARAWITQMPHTFDALRAGVLSQWRATLMVRETSHLTPEHRARIDDEICGPAGLADLARMGTRRLIARIKKLAAELDVHACVKRNAKAVTERRVSVRPAPDLMVYLTALVPMQQGVQAYAQLKAHADAARATGDERGAGQIMVDTLIERVTGREQGHADDVPVMINLLVSDQALFAGGDEPAVVPEGMPAGAGTVPGPVARNLVAHGIDAGAAWLRAIYVDPRGRLLATTSASRFYPRAWLRCCGRGGRASVARRGVTRRCGTSTTSFRTPRAVRPAWTTGRGCVSGATTRSKHRGGGRGSSRSTAGTRWRRSRRQGTPMSPWRPHHRNRCENRNRSIARSGTAPGNRPWRGPVPSA
ncbi:protein of unknown function (DUF222) [Promicromonospora umidemergens]|uniref:DUF222 domain-containing protein n=1 Tax=Promicromonospora umidemergens TaxID=629679 RepID=A0ABP8WQJ8_9MICO|nr:protein of unknown function (DUF222) [Promicromonospora umidemergens]